MVGRIIVLLILIFVLAAGGILWLDYLTVIDAKTTLAPFYRLINREARTQSDLAPDEFINLDAERLAVRLEAGALRDLEMDKREAEIKAKQDEIEQMAQDIAQQQAALDDQQKSINDGLEAADTVSRNVEGVAQQLYGMPPERAVAIIAEMNDQQAIDVLRKTDEIAQRDGTGSLVPYWMSLLPPQRAAELQRKMVGRPQ
ncbi:MAG: flagellar protein FlbB [Treponema sp.]|nr:flagellar protein FlbB [Treponema sp.]